jgi:peptide-methionine (S)-S-oxide reductase
METAIFGGGCFWCVEAGFELARGVNSVTSGYGGGETPAPSYAAVCGGDTGHAELVRLEYDPSVISYETLLDMFFTLHDPTTLNRQGNDVGTQYRSIIICQNAEQKDAATAKIAALNASGAFSGPLVTEVIDAVPFYPAEADHQGYYRDHGWAPYCSMVIAPKVSKFSHRFAALLK